MDGGSINFCVRWRLDFVGGFDHEVVLCDRIFLWKGIIEHPNVTQKILEQLTDSEYEEVAEFAREKLQEFE